MTPTTIHCPNCGAPAAVPMGQASSVCSFCHQPFQVPGAQPPPPPPQAWAPQQQIPSIVVIGPGEYGSPIAASVGTAAAFTGLRVLLAIIPVVVIALVGGVTWFSAGRATGMLGGGWSGTTPLVCGGNDSISASDVTVSYTSGSAINVGGNCHVKCTRCTLKAPVGVAAGGNGQVDLVDSHLEGSIVAGGNAQVRMLGNSTFSGDVQKGGNADVMVPPGSQRPSTPSIPAVPAVPAPPAAPRPPVAPPPAPHRR